MKNNAPKAPTELFFN